MNDSTDTRGWSTLAFPTTGEVLRTAHGTAVALVGFGVVLATLGVIFAPFSGGLLDPAAGARGLATWTIGFGMLLLAAANGVEWARQRYRIEPVDDPGAVDMEGSA